MAGTQLRSLLAIFILRESLQDAVGHEINLTHLAGFVVYWPLMKRKKLVHDFLMLPRKLLNSSSFGFHNSKNSLRRIV